MTALRPYQQDAIARLRAAYAAGARAPLLVMPTGAGKTVVFAHVCASILARGRTALVLVHRRELIRQASAKLHAAGVAHGIIAPGFTPTRDPIQVASVQTLQRRLANLPLQHVDLIVIDEAHHASAGSWHRIVSALRNARLLGVTATPERLDGKGLGTHAGGPFDVIVEGPSIADLVRDGYLVPTEIYAPADAPDLSRTRVRAGDWARDDLERLLDRPQIVGCAVEHYGRLCPGQPAIAFCVSVRHAHDVAAGFRAAGWRAAAVDGAMGTAERDRSIAGLADGSVQVLTSCDLISEGLDVPAVSAVILLRPTMSLVLHMQQIGRGMRPADGKQSLIVLDHAGNVLRHGLPDEPRAWSLDGAKARRSNATRALPALKRCPSCFVVHKPAPYCPACGHVYESEARQVRQVSGELEKLDPRRIAALRSTPLRALLRSARTDDDLRAIAEARGYKPGWVWHIQQKRRQRA
jgi:superfamily II DNA or RNA helicase